MDSKEVPFDDSHWESARDYIDSKRKDQRNRWVYLSLAALLIIGTLFTVLIPQLDQPKDSTVSTREPAAIISSPQRSDAPVADSRPAQNSESVQKALPEKPASEKKIQQDHLTATRANNGTVNAVIRKKVKTSSAITSTQATPVLSNSEPENGAIETIDNSENKKEESQTPLVTSVPPVVSAPPVAGQQTTPDKQEQVVTANVGVDPSQEPVKEAAVAVVENPPATTTATVAQEEIKKEENKPETAKAAAIPSVAASNEQSGAIPLTNAETKEILWSVEGGISCMFGWKGTDGREANGINPVLGIHYFDYLNEKISVSFGAQYNRVGNLSNSSFSSSVTRYSLGEESKVTVITPSRLHYITVPFRCNYNFDTKNSVGFAYSISYLMNVEARVDKYTVIMGQRSDESTYTTAGYTEGFRLFDSQLSLFYKRSLYKGIGAKAEFFFGLNDIKDNTFFKADVFERNAGIKLMLVYDIFRK